MSIDLRTHFGGLILHSPIVVGACPLSLNEQTRVAMETAGAGAIVLPSLFEEQVIEWSHRLGRSLTSQEETLLARSARTRANWACQDAECYLSLVNRASTQHSIPIIASLNGYNAGRWMDFAGELQEAGAAAIELNVQHPRGHQKTEPVEIEDAIVESVREINSAIGIPLFVKLGTGHTNVPALAQRLMSGTQALVMFGRTPDLDICLDSFKLRSHWGLSQPGTVTNYLDTVMQVHAACPAISLAVSGGVGHADDVLKAILAGADVTMVTSILYREGPDAIRAMIDGVVVFMEKHGCKCLRDLHLKRPLEFDSDEERTVYMTALSARLHESESRVVEPMIHGDRWGHTHP